MARTLADYLADALQRRGWSRRTLALYAEISPNTASRLLKGEGNPDPETLRKVAAALGVDELTLSRLAGHVDDAQLAPLDPEAAYIARRLTDLPPDLRERAIDAVAGVLDALTAPGRLGPRLVDTPELYDAATLVEEIIEDRPTLTPEEEEARALRLLKRHDPAAFEALYAESVAKLRALGIDPGPG